MVRNAQITDPSLLHSLPFSHWKQVRHSRGSGPALKESFTLPTSRVDPLYSDRSETHYRLLITLWPSDVLISTVMDLWWSPQSIRGGEDRCRVTDQQNCDLLIAQPHMTPHDPHSPSPSKPGSVPARPHFKKVKKSGRFLHGEALVR